MQLIVATAPEDDEVDPEELEEDASVLRDAEKQCDRLRSRRGAE